MSSKIVSSLGYLPVKIDIPLIRIYAPMIPEKKMTVKSKKTMERTAMRTAIDAIVHQRTTLG